MAWVGTSCLIIKSKDSVNYPELAYILRKMIMITVAKLQDCGERGLIWIAAKITFIAEMCQTHKNDITTIPLAAFSSPTVACPSPV